MVPGREQLWLNALRWVMTQPGLLEGLPGGHAPLLDEADPRLEGLLQKTAADPSGLLALLDGPRGHKVGIAFEALMQWGVEQGLGYRCLARDVQIMDDKRTVGALDLILAAPDGTHEHWEFAYKLFLQVDEGVEWSSWLGPGGRDRLDVKVNRMLEHQLPLSRSPAEQTLERLGVGSIDRQRIVLQGVLFTPWAGPDQRAVSGHRLAQGRWLRPSQVGAMVETKPDALWVKREKPHWFGPWSGSMEQALSGSELEANAEGSAFERAELWSGLSPEQLYDQALFFVVPEDWGSG